MSPQRRPKLILGEWITKSDYPAYAVDSKYRIRYVNRGLELLAGVGAVDLVGKQCRYSSEPSDNRLDQLLGAMCPPASSFQGQLARQSITFPIADNNVEQDSIKNPNRTYEVSFIPIREADEIVETAPVENKIVFVILLPAEADLESPLPRLEESLHTKLLHLRQETRRHFSFDTLVGQTPLVQSALRKAKVASQCLESVHFVGERGTGKLHWARAIHQQSPNQKRSFVPMDCRRLSSIQIRRILKRLTQFEAEEASEEMAPGTVFFSHIDHLTLDIQVEVREMFGRMLFPIRMMSSSTVDLESLVASEEFDERLFHMLRTLSIQLPRLLERHDDLPLLAQSMLEQCNADSDKQIDGFADDVLIEFQRYAWPANLTELNVVVREAHKVCQSTTVQKDDLPFRFRAGMDAQAIGPARTFSGIDLEQHLQQVEMDQIQLALETAKHNKTKAAQLLGLTRAKLYRRMEQLGLSDEERP